MYLDSSELNELKELASKMNDLNDEQVSASNITRRLIIEWCAYQKKARKLTVDDSVNGFRMSA